MQKLVTTYSELGSLVNVFNQDKLEIMIIEGPAGVGKSNLIKRNLPTTGHVWLEGRVSAFRFYTILSEHLDLPVFIDDVDGLYTDKDCINLLKCICQTEPVKTVMWNTKSNLELKSFTTKSKVLVITNSWHALNRHIGAVEDRGLLVRFKPAALEVHEHIKGIFNQDVYDFIGEHLELIHSPSIRLYRTASQLMDLDWKGMLIESFGIKHHGQMCVLKLRAVHASENEKAKMFELETGLSNRTYYRIKSDLQLKKVPF